MKQNIMGANKLLPNKNTEFSFYKAPIQNVLPERNIDLTTVHKFITSEYEEETIKLRGFTDISQRKLFKNSQLDYVTFNGTFSKRKDNCLILLSYLFVIDIDHIKSKILTQVYEKLKNDKILLPQLIFISPSGNGLKVVVRIDCSIIDINSKSKMMDPIWEAINSYFSTEYSTLLEANEKGHYIDEAGKDVSRACFLCHHPNAYLNDNINHILGQEFITRYPPLKNLKKPYSNNKNNCGIEKIKVNPETTLDDLAKRHLNAADNHHPQLLAFVGAAISINTPKEDTFRFIEKFVNISEDSKYAGAGEIDKLVDDAYSRYDISNKEIIRLSPFTFAYNILYFTGKSKRAAFVTRSLYRVGVIDVLSKAGFKKRRIGNDFIIILKEGCIIKETTEEMLVNYFKSYLKQLIGGFSFEFLGITYHISENLINEIYLRDGHNILNKNCLRNLPVHEEPILKDTEKEMYFFFKNGLVTLSVNGIKKEDWHEKKGFCIWADQVIQHDFICIENFSESHFYKFLCNVTDNDVDRKLTMYTAIGYLLHNYFKESEGQAVVFYDQTITDITAPMGGSGKGLIFNAIKCVRNVTKIDGKLLDYNSRFKWELITPSTQVVWIDDVRPDFDFAMLHSNLTDGWTVERKYKPQIFVAPKDSPKPGLCSNSILKCGGSTNKRRQFPIELSDYYSKQIKIGTEQPIEKEHGCIFFSAAWSEKEWNMFYCVMMECGRSYLQHGLKAHKGINVELNRFRQTTDPDFASWVDEQRFEKKVRYETKKYYSEYTNIFYGDSLKLSQRKFTSYLKAFSIHKSWTFKITPSNGISYFLFE